MKTLNQNEQHLPLRDFLINKGITLEELANVTRLKQDKLSDIACGYSEANRLYQNAIVYTLNKRYGIAVKLEDLFPTNDCA